MSGKVMAWVAQQEEVGLTDEEYVPEDAVLKVNSMITDTETRTTSVQGIQNVRGSKSKTVLREAVIHW
jgi:hypothetical protein